MEKKDLPIGVFDSGVGGISVLKELKRLMPAEDFYYFGDSLHAPYGTKKENEICELTLHHIQNMMNQGVKAIVIACNTATSVAITRLREKYEGFIVVGMEPALKPAVTHWNGKNIGVMATPVTLHLDKFQHLLGCYDHDANIIPLPCPGLAEYVEQGIIKGHELEKLLVKLFEPIDNISVDAVVLGCTHYPFIKDSISKVLKYSVEIFDGGEGTANETKRRLMAEGLLKEVGKGNVQLKSSLDTPEMLSHMRFLLNSK